MPRADAPDDFYYKVILCPYSVVRNFTKHYMHLAVDGSNNRRENAFLEPEESMPGPLMEGQYSISLAAYRKGVDGT